MATINGIENNQFLGKILIVDDEQIIRDVLVNMLENEGNYELLTAANGQEALEICMEQPIDLVFTDIKMPVMDGMTFLAELRKTGSEIPVVIITAYGNREEVIHALRLGASNFLMKPNEIKMVHSLADKLLRSRHKEIMEQQLYQYFLEENQHYKIPNNLQFTIPLIDIITEKVQRIGLCDHTELINLRIALDEALMNAMIHGNLELESEEKGTSLKELIEFNKTVKQRCKEEPYSERTVSVDVRLTGDQADFIISDEGKGFDWTKVPTSFDNINVLANHGRGLIIIHTFMDEVRFNENGNQITMIKSKNSTQPSIVTTKS